MVTTKLMTAEEVEFLPEGQRYDLIQGRLITMSPAGRRHGRLASRVGFLIAGFAIDHGGEAYAAETGFILARHPDTVLGPDAAYVRPERITPDLPDTGYLPIAPDLAVEVLSPSNTRAEMTEKVAAYLAGGTALLWIIDPERRSVTVYTRDGQSGILGEGETLDGGEVLPGFSLPVADLFV